MLNRSFAVALLFFLCAAAPASAGVRIALLPISVHAAGEDSEYLQSGLAEMIAARLDQYDGVSVVRPKVKGVEPAAAETARAVGEGAGADFVLYGSFTRFGNGASLDLRCLPVDGGAHPEHEQNRRMFIQSGSLAEIIPKLDTLAQRVARYAIATGRPPVVTGSGKDTAAASGGPSASDYEALVERVKELERALIPPVAEKAAEGDALVR